MTEANLEVEWRPRGGDNQSEDPNQRDEFRIQWIESGTEGIICGWHQDDTHPDLGAVHFQVERENDGSYREPATFGRTHPLNVLSVCLDRLSEKLRELRR